MDDDNKKKGPRGPGKPGGERGAGSGRSGGGERSGGGRGGFGGKPRGAEGAPKGERKFGERKFGDKPRGPRGDKPFGAKPFGDRPARREYSSDRPPRPSRDGVDVVVKPTRRFASENSPRESGDGEAASERIAKRLARAGISSRRDAEMLIAQGRVKVNGAILASPARDVTANDRIEVDGKEIPPIERTRVFLFHKPSGVVTTNRDPEGRKTVFDELPQGLPRLITVGRLDINTEGLLMLTNDGGLARMLELPSTGWTRRYRARVHGKVDEARLASLKDGIAIDGVFYGSIEASLEREQGTNAWLSISLREGKNREVKNILGALGLEVTRLIRISYGPFQLGELAEGQVLEIKGRILREQLGDNLIEESGANFDADVIKPFSNKPVHRRDAPERTESAPPRERRDITVGEGGLVRNFRKDRERAQEDFRDRLTTSRPNDRRDGERRPGRFDGPRSGDGPRGRDGAAPRGRPAGRRDEAPETSDKSRTVNVWRAPGARPARTERTEAPRSNERRNDGDRRDGARRGDDRAPRAPRVEGERSFRGPRPDGDRPSRGPRIDGDRPFRGPRAEGDRPARAPRQEGDRPYGDRPPRGPRPDGDRPSRGPRPDGDRPRGPRPDGDRPARGPRPEGGRPGGRPSGDRPFSGRPSGDRPGGNRPTGGRPAGGRPPRKG